MKRKVDESLGRLIVWALALATLVITPEQAVDPINPPKMLALGGMAFMSLGLIAVNVKVVGFAKYKATLFLVGIFLTWLIVAMVFSGGDFYQQLFGANGRNTGFITYLAFSIILLACVIASNANFFPKLLKVVLFVGVLSLAYGLIQDFGFDPFNWVNPYSPVFGFLGNPNFQSSLLGVLGSVVFAYLFMVGLSIGTRLILSSYLLVTLYVIKETNSQQGFLVLLIGIVVVLAIYLRGRSKVLILSYGVLSLVGFVGVLIGTLNKGPLASLLYKDSVTYRGDYWRAGWKMTVEHPIFGVGLDSYGDWYRRSRTVAATLRRGPDVTSNAAHNVYLDISSYGGFPLLAAYVGLMALVVVSIIKVLKRTKTFNPGYAGLVGGWIAFQAQSIISINQIGLAIWGWVFSGLLIGFEINTRPSIIAEENKKSTKVEIKPTRTSPVSVLSMFVGLVIGLVVAMPPYMATAKFKAAARSGSAQQVQEAAYLWPTDSSRMIQIVKILVDNQLISEGLKVVQDAAVKYPNSYPVWATLIQMPGITAEEKAEALRQMKRLDPNNPNL